MQEQKIEELEMRASLLLEQEAQTLAQQLSAQSVIRNEIDAMRREDKVLTLSVEEERMLRAFRGFKARTKPGGVFKWQTRPTNEVVVAALEDTALIRDPQEVS